MFLILFFLIGFVCVKFSINFIGIIWIDDFDCIKCLYLYNFIIVFECRFFFVLLYKNKNKKFYLLCLIL